MAAAILKFCLHCIQVDFQFFFIIIFLIISTTVHVVRKENWKKLGIASPQELRYDSRGGHGYVLRTVRVLKTLQSHDESNSPQI